MFSLGLCFAAALWLYGFEYGVIFYFKFDGIDL